MKNKARNFILFGVISPILYFGASFIGGSANNGYSHIRDSVSDLLVKGSPRLLLLDIMMVLSFVIIMISTSAILMVHGKNLKKVTKVGIIIIGLTGLFSFLSSIVFRLNPQDTGMSLSSIMHISFVALSAIGTVVGGLLIGLSMKEVEGWKRFRLFTVISLLILLLGGVMAPLIVSLDMDIIGLVERLSILAYHQWFVVLLVKFYKLDIGSKKIVIS